MVTKKKSVSDGGFTPIKKKMTKNMILSELLEAADLAQDRQGYQITESLSTADTKRVVKAVYERMEELMIRSVMPKSIGVFMFPKMFKLIVKDRPAIRKGTKVRHPGTGEMVPSKGRPASKKPRISALKTLRDVVNGELPVK